MLNTILTKTLKAAGRALETRKEAIEFAERIERERRYSPTPGIIFNYIGEHAKDFNAIYKTFIHYYILLQHTAEESHERDISIKISQFGNYPYFISRLVEEMLTKKRRLWIDAEEYEKAEGQLIMARHLADRFYNKAFNFCPVGLTIQLKSNTYLEDAKACFGEGMKVRLCKGAYPSKIEKCELMTRAKEVVSAYDTRLTDAQFTIKAAKPNLLEIATTGDINLVMLALEHKLPLQLLYGWHEKFIEYPYGVKIYTPFGNNWGPYIVRRIKEKANR
jgi:hypothetical protein